MAILFGQSCAPVSGSVTGLFANPGQTVVLAVEVLDGQGSRVDGYQPTLNFVRGPDGSNLPDFPDLMIRDSVGLYNLGVSIPSGVSAIGTYIASASWTHPNLGVTQYQLFLINVALPFGSASGTPA